MNSKIRNAVAEILSLLSVIYGLLPSWSAANYAPPAWVGLLFAGVITVGNQLLKDTETPPPPAPPSSP